jgi:hypothetical protein
MQGSILQLQLICPQIQSKIVLVLINLENPSPCFQFVLNHGLYCCETSNRRIMMQVKNRLVLGWRNSIGQNQK